MGFLSLLTGLVGMYQKRKDAKKAEDEQEELEAEEREKEAAADKAAADKRKRMVAGGYRSTMGAATRQTLGG